MTVRVVRYSVDNRPTVVIRTWLPYDIAWSTIDCAAGFGVLPSAVNCTNYKNKREVRIDSYFTFPTDLAEKMSSWSEFISGKEYVVSLKSQSENVSTSLEYEEGQPFVVVRGWRVAILRHIRHGAVRIGGA